MATVQNFLVTVEVTARPISFQEKQSRLSLGENCSICGGAGSWNREKTEFYCWSNLEHDRPYSRQTKQIDADSAAAAQPAKEDGEPDEDSAQLVADIEEFATKAPAKPKGHSRKRIDVECKVCGFKKAKYRFKVGRKIGDTCDDCRRAPAKGKPKK